MRKTGLTTAITFALLALCGSAPAQNAETEAAAPKKEAKAPKSKHKFKSSLDFEVRTNNNVGLAPSSLGGLDFASFADFGADEEEGEEGDDEEDEDEDDDFGDDFGDDLDEGYDEDEIEEDDGFDEDGDGIDDLIDPNADNQIDSETRFSTKLGLGYKYAISKTTTWANTLKVVSDRHADRDELNKVNFSIGTGIEFAPKGSNWKFKPSISYVRLSKDSDKFVTTFIASVAAEYEVNKRFSLGAAYNYQDKDVTKFTSPDATIDTLALSAEIKATDNDIFKLKLAPKVEDSTKATRSKDASGADITYTRKLPWDMLAGIGFQYDSTDYKNLEPTRRKDKDYTWALTLAKEFTKQVSASIGYETRERRSDAPNKDAENDSYMLEVSIGF